MLEVKGNAWDLFKNYNALCITTNGFVKANGECVMGRGIALECKQYFPSIPKLLGSLIIRKGNNVHMLGTVNNSIMLVSFPVKHNWFENADIKLIEQSANQLVKLADNNNWNKILIPRPGCGNGNLKWSNVKPVLETIFDDRFHIVSF